MSIKDSIIPHIRDITTFIGTWNTLEVLYEVTNSNVILSLKRKLLSINMEENENATSYSESRIKGIN